MSPKGRHAKSKARITSYEALLGQEGEKRAKDLEIYIPPGPRLGDVVIEAKQVSKGYGDQAPYRRSVVFAPARRDRRDHRSERRREDDPVPDDHRPGET